MSEFTSTIMGVMSRFIPNKIITCNDKDPPWITPEIKTAIKRKHRVYNDKYVRRGRRPDEWDNVRLIRNDTSKMITIAKDNYFASLGRNSRILQLELKHIGPHLTKLSTRKRRQIYHHYLKMDYLLLTFRINLKYSIIILFNSVP